MKNQNYDKDNDLMLLVVKEIYEKNIKEATHRIFLTLLLARAYKKELIDFIFDKFFGRIDYKYLIKILLYLMLIFIFRFL